MAVLKEFFHTHHTRQCKRHRLPFSELEFLPDHSLGEWVLHEVSVDEDVSGSRHHACVKSDGHQVLAHGVKQCSGDVLLLKLGCSTEEQNSNHEISSNV